MIDEQRENNLAAVAKLMQESCRIWIHRSVVQRYSPRMRIRNKSTNPLGICYTLWGGTFYPEKRRKKHKSVTNYWEVTGERTHKAATEILPFLVGAQARRAALLVSFYELCFLSRDVSKPGLRTRLTVDEQVLRDNFRQKMLLISDTKPGDELLGMEKW